VSELGRAAMGVAQGELVKRVRGGLPGWGRFRSARIDDYMRSVGLVPHLNPAQEGWPWCAAAIHFCFALATPDGAPNPCPRTAGAIHLWDTSPLTARTQLPAPGDVFVLDKGKGRGHVGFVVTVSPDGKTIGSLEPDSSPAGSRTGDSWAEHPLWQPTDGARGRLVGFLEF